MREPDKETIERLRREFPIGCRIVLDEMRDPYEHLPEGMQGECRGVDDAGNILVNWDGPSSLSVAYGADRAHRGASDTEVKKSLDWLGKRQRRATGLFHCPRCGKKMEGIERHALSRYADVTVCDDCGQQEALEIATYIPAKLLSKWWCVENNWKL